ncbi:MAG: alcohol dehydrogenase catalytic domain-containing protein [Thermotogae bacterium]|nr:alcohol dehydrogenase catalytic domain-containing protein [Thermotogota bacterium]
MKGKAAVLGLDRKISIVEREVPKPKEGEVLINVKACGVCRTDHHIYHGQFNIKQPVVLGHEFSGVVVGVGKGVKDFKEGDKVAAHPIIACGKCEYCVSGHSNLCENAKVLGGAGEDIYDGGFQEYTVVPEKNLRKFVDSVDFEEAAFAEPLGCAVRGIQKSRLSLGEKVLIIGAGPMGLLLTQLASIYGASLVIVSEIDEQKRRIAEQLGANITIDPKTTDVVEFVKDITNGGVNLAIEAVGKVETFETAFKSLRKMGRAMIFGVPSDTAEYSIPLFPIYYKEYEIIGSYAISYESFNIAVELLNNKRINVKPLISHRFKLDEILDAFDLMDRNIGLKKMIKM